MAKAATSSRRAALRETPVEAVTTAHVSEWLRDRIRRGRLVAGQRLVEADLVRDTGASRSRVREALQRLESEGLVSIEEFRGASVRRFSRDELAALYATRAVLEGLAAREFAARAADTDKAALKDAQRALDEAVGQADNEAFARWNDRWHHVLIAGSGNAYVVQFVDRLRIPVSRLLFSSFHSRQRLDAANADHRVITAAVLAGDGEAAEAAMRAHVEAGFAALLANGVED